MPALSLLQVRDLRDDVSAQAAARKRTAARDRVVVDVVADRDAEIIGQLRLPGSTTAV